MKFLTVVLFSILSTLSLASNKVPRQKIIFSGLTKTSNSIEVSVADLEKLKNQVTFSIYDPYNKDIKTQFKNISFETIINEYADKSATSMLVKAIDGYSVLIKVEDAKKIPLYVAFKDENGYLSVDRMGPVRIIEKHDSKINKELLAKIGVNWVWQVKTIEFKK